MPKSIPSVDPYANDRDAIARDALDEVGSSDGTHKLYLLNVDAHSRNVRSVTVAAIHRSQDRAKNSAPIRDVIQVNRRSRDDAARIFERDAGGEAPIWLELIESIIGSAAGLALGHDASFGSGPNPHTITADYLMQMHFSEPVWAVRDLIPPGLSLMAGKPKSGKSWMALAIALAVTGAIAIPGLEVCDGDALYVTCEDSERGLQSRISMLLDGEPPPVRLELATEWPRLDAGGLAALEAWIDGHPLARLIVLDPFAALRGERSRTASSFEDDYRALEGVKRIAEGRDLAILMIHHTRKQAADDPIDLISGTTGYGAIVDAFLVLLRDRHSDTATLHVDGREVMGREIALKWDPTTTRWSFLGDAAERREVAARDTILAVLAESSEPLSTQDVAELTGKKAPTVRWHLNKLVQEGQVIRPTRGRFTVATSGASTTNKQTSEDSDQPQASAPRRRSDGSNIIEVDFTNAPPLNRRVE